MLGNLFGSKETASGTGSTPAKKNPFDFDLNGGETEEFTPPTGESIVRNIYVLGKSNIKVLPKNTDFQMLPPLVDLSNRGYRVDAKIHYVDGFRLYADTNEAKIMESWGEVMNIFKGTDEDEVDNIILVGPSFTPYLESRRIFLEKVFDAIGEDYDRYEHIRQCLQFWAPVNTQKEFHRWALI